MPDSKKVSTSDPFKAFSSSVLKSTIVTGGGSLVVQAVTGINPAFTSMLMTIFRFASKQDKTKEHPAESKLGLVIGSALAGTVIGAAQLYYISQDLKQRAEDAHSSQPSQVNEPAKTNLLQIQPQ